MSLEELGVLREIKEVDGIFEIIITPTYSGCPAMNTMAEDIRCMLDKNGISNYKIVTVHSPAWTTDWMTDQAKEKLRTYGIAPPSQSTSSHLEGMLSGKYKPVTCPFCGSNQTRLTSAFGSTACKALHYCNACHQPFEEFKCH